MTSQLHARSSISILVTDWKLYTLSLILASANQTDNDCPRNYYGESDSSAHDLLLRTWREDLSSTNSQID
jgi:hypothetical protein